MRYVYALFVGFMVRLFLQILIAWLALSVPSPHAFAEDTEGSGIVKISANQKRALVYVDRELAGEAPTTRYLTAGPHSIRVVKDHFDPYVRRINVKAGTTVELMAKLVSGKGTVEVQAEPRGARMLLQGKDEWPLPVRLRDMAEAEYTYKIIAPGFEPVEGRFTYQKGKNLLIFEKLKSSAGLMTISTTPQGAVAFMDGEELGVTPLSLTAIEAGPHVVRFEAKGFATVFRSVDTSDGSKGVVEARLPKGGARLVLKTGQKDARVYFDTLEVGNGRRVVFPSLERGRYHVTISAPDEPKVTGQVKVPSRGKVSYKTVYGDRTSRKASRIIEIPPLTRRWGFWSAVGVLVSGGTVGGIMALNSAQIIEIPEGDVVLGMP